MRVTIAEVARRARVSKTTVSRVLNNKGDVDAATAIRVREVIAATGLHAERGAVGLARGRTQTVGMLVPGLTWPWMGDVLQGVADVLEAQRVRAAAAHRQPRRGLAGAVRPARVGQRVRRAAAGRAAGHAVLHHGLHESGPAGRHDRRPRPPPRLPVRGDEQPTRAPPTPPRTCSAPGRTPARDGHRPGDVRLHPRPDRRASTPAGRDAGVDLDPRLMIEGDFTRGGGQAAIAELLANGRRRSTACSPTTT